MRPITTALILCVVSAALAFGGQHAGRRAPGFSLPDSSNRQHDLQDYRGKLLLIDIMKTDCAHCVPFSRVLERAKAKYGDRIAVLKIVHPPDTRATVERYISEHKITSPILFDCGQVAFSYILPSPLNPQIQVPNLFIIGPDGMIRNHYEYGAKTKAIFEGEALFKEIDRLLGAASPARKP